MALFTDGPLTTQRELQQYESGILNVASVENIDLTAKATLAQDVIATELLLFLDRNSYWEARLPVTRTVSLDNIVATDPLKRWHAYKTLASVYEDAYNNQLNDRYQGKWKQYDQLANTNEQTLFRLGVGVVQQPVPKAAAPSLKIIPMGVTGSSYYVRISWVGTSGQEGGISDATQATSADGSAVVVSVSTPPPSVASWNIYAGSAPDGTTLQNTSPLSIDDTWMVPATGLTTGRPPGSGQAPDWWIVDHRILPRG